MTLRERSEIVARIRAAGLSEKKHRWKIRHYLEDLGMSIDDAIALAKRRDAESPVHGIAWRQLDHAHAMEHRARLRSRR